MRVFVAGGTGAVGGHAIPTLVREGHSVTALAPYAGEDGHAHNAGSDPGVGVAVWPPGVTAVFTGHDAVVNPATAIPPMSWWISAKAWRST